jgi:phytoene dehydrogenase-like protein
MNAYDLLEEHFGSDSLKGAFGLDAVLGANFGPRSPGTVLTLLHRMAGQSLGDGGLRQPEGGMGALCEALARAAVASGAEVRTDAPVSKLIVKDDRVCGVELSNGERLEARIVISNADPKTTFLKLLGASHLDTGFVRRITHLRTKGLAAKLHLALDAAPKFGGEASLSRGRMLIAPSLNHIERAFNHSKYGEFSADPVMEITVPTLNDATLAPPGKHVLSAVVQYAPYTLKGGWEQGRAAFTDAAIGVLERHAPGLRDQILAAEMLTPVDIEEKFGIDGGHWHHADLAFDQFLMMRPVPGVAQHRAPITGLYLCGAGCHPGGGVMGIAGSNAAREVLAAGGEA